MSVRRISQNDLKRIVLNVLRSSILQTIRFSYISPAMGKVDLHFSGTSLQAVAQKIETGRIALNLFVRPTARTHHGAYIFDSNRLTISSDTFFSMERNPHIVHECVHASHDVYAVRLPRIDIELIAYVTQAAYTLQAGLPLLRYMPRYRDAAVSAIKTGEIGSDEVYGLYDFLASRSARRGINMRGNCGDGSTCYEWLAFDGVV